MPWIIDRLWEKYVAYLSKIYSIINTQSPDASTNLMRTCGNGHIFSLAGSWDAEILMLPVQRPV